MICDGDGKQLDDYGMMDEYDHSAGLIFFAREKFCIFYTCTLITNDTLFSHCDQWQFPYSIVPLSEA
jgi:hypothetical protein